MHPYTADPQSGAGNCTCGHPERAWRHPHKFTPSAIAYNGGRQDMCTCGLPARAECHRLT